MLPASELSSPAGMTEKFPCLFHDKELESLQREDPGSRIHGRQGAQALSPVLRWVQVAQDPDSALRQ